jgi:hypothetical protein
MSVKKKSVRALGVVVTAMVVLGVLEPLMTSPAPHAQPTGSAEPAATAHGAAEPRPRTA